jgi:tetratricopeptide (TPR) repeat protein
LQEEQACLVADSTELGAAVLAVGYPSDSPANLAELLASARDTGIDGLILGEVLEWHCSGQPVRAPTVQQGRMRVQIRLVDSQTGDVRAAREIDRRAERKLDRDIPADESTMLHELAQAAVDEFVAALAARRETAEVELSVGEWYAPGSWRLRRGARLARQGRWEEAVDHWEGVLSRHPESDAALFNLAVAAGQRQDFCAAEDYAMQALRLRHTDCYARGLEQLRQFQADYDRIERLHRGPVVPASHTAWRD